MPLLDYKNEDDAEIKFNKKRYEKMQHLGMSMDGV